MIFVVTYFEVPLEKENIHLHYEDERNISVHKKMFLIKKEKKLLDFTGVCSLLTKQFIQVGLQIQCMFCNFKMVSLPIHGTVKSF
jgi:hypothetical protein